MKSAVDFDILKQELSNEVVEGKDERYEFVWPDKKKAILLAATFQTVLQYGIVKGEKSIYAERVRVDFFHVVIDRLLVHADY